ncbi:hypothetical protein [Maribacter sp. ACAM166]|uniref:hypothetical protein n=1 Tax=Maribacter sp. ACAM166 TaxID=2508996 RepID=UPI0010FD6B41|nr:hypothetical protein [Maribacter sp. ACAM166]TLP82181.1 hypothetical protein ES765_01730 [Maribacter sp. ACAM166]
MKIVIALLVTFIGVSAFSQTELNDYKYIIVPKKFSNFKNENQYQTSTLIKYLFKGKGFNTVYDDELPTDLNSNRCLGLLADLQDDSSMFTTKTSITLKDCNSNVVFKTMQGLSKEKVYKAAYTETVRESMRSFNGASYTYNGKSEKNEPITVSFKNDIKKLDTPKIAKVTRVDSTKENVKTVHTSAVTEKATETNQYYKNAEPVESNIKKANQKEPSLKKIALKKLNVKDIWYAQATDNGFQLVDSTPTIRMKLLKSSADNVFMAQTEAKNGMVYQKDGKWVFEYYEKDQLIQEELNIKF